MDACIHIPALLCNTKPLWFLEYFETFFVLAFISPGQARDGSGALGLGEPQLCADPQGLGGTACKPHQPDRLPLPP